MSWNQVAFAVKLGLAATLVFTTVGTGFIGLVALVGYMLTHQTFISTIIGLLGVMAVLSVVFTIVIYLFVLAEDAI